jgi:hypothetical protein
MIIYVILNEQMSWLCLAAQAAWYTMADTGDIESDLKQTIVMYTTSMRAVRKTFEQCQTGAYTNPMHFLL